MIRKLNHSLAMTRHLGSWSGLIAAVASVGTCVAVGLVMERMGIALPNVYMLFLLGVVFVSARHGAEYGVLAAVFSVCALAFFFMAPILSLAVADLQQVLALAVLFTIGVVVSGLTSQVRRQARDAERNANRLDSLYRLSRELADLAGTEALVRASVRHVHATFGGEAAVFLRDRSLQFRAIPATGSFVEMKPVEWGAIQAACEQKTTTGTGADHFAYLSIYCIPLVSVGDAMGALVYRLPSTESALSDEQRQLLQTIAHQVSGALERDRLSTQMQVVQDEVENERLRSALLSSVSHDLRTPLAVVVGASSSLIDDKDLLDGPTREGLHQTIFDNSNRLARLVDNLLNMTQLESGTVQVHKQLHVLEEVIGTTLHSVADLLQGRKVETDLPIDLPLVPIDAVLIQQLLFNLVDNAIKYDDSGKPLRITIRLSEVDQVQLEVSDRGPGLPPGEEEKVFDKFFRGSNTKAGLKGSGLGLTICRAIVLAHGGRISAHTRTEGGATFRVLLPLTPCEDPKAASEVTVSATRSSPVSLR